MSMATADLLNALSEVATIQEMKVTLNVSAQCGMIAGMTTLIGGLAGGPPGIAIGGLLGTVMASYHGNGKFKSVPEILLTEATPEQQEKLAEAIRKVLTTENILTLVQFVALIQSDKLLMETIQSVVRQFITSDMGLKLLS